MKRSLFRRGSTKSNEFLVISDTNDINKLYRSELTYYLKQEFSKVYLYGLFDKNTVLPMIAKILKLNTFIISSNLKSNFVSLMFFWKKGVVILNGIGRYRGDKVLRVTLLLLFRLNWRKAIIVQSCADYRYFRRFSLKEYYWVPGSGGRYKKFGPKKRMLLIQRDDKIQLVFHSVSKLLDSIQSKPLSIVGCQDHEMVYGLFKDYKVNSIGRKDPEDIFLEGGVFIQPSGYGEGFPHTLADAIVSDLEIYIDSKEFIRYGLGRLGGGRKKISDNWCKLEGSKDISHVVNSDSIVASYMKIIRLFI